MLKPYKQRVEGTYHLMQQMILIAEKDKKKIKELRNNATTNYSDLVHYPITWTIDTSQTSTLNFKGFEADKIKSKVTGFNRLKYDRNRPFTKEVIYQNYYEAIDSVIIPEAYVIKKEWTKAITLLKLNAIEHSILKRDTTIIVDAYRISDYKTQKQAYEGHYPHYNTKVESSTKEVLFSEGDILVPTDQKGIRYLLETLEPSAKDSFFNWNFFDVILQQKEGFSPYVFEDEALEMLQNDDKLKSAFETKKTEDQAFADNWYAQLDWLFKRSEHYEPSHMQYPIYRILKN
jgi:hypothetical protein